jgi:hypothetical protein
MDAGCVVKSERDVRAVGAQDLCVERRRRVNEMIGA